MSAANKLTKQIIAAFERIGGAAARVNVTGIQRNGRWTKSGSLKGFEDVDAIYPYEISGFKIGVKVAVEVKIGKDKQSPEQKERQAKVEQAGGIYIVAKDYDQFIETLNTELEKKLP